MGRLVAVQKSGMGSHKYTIVLFDDSVSNVIGFLGSWAWRHEDGTGHVRMRAAGEGDQNAGFRLRLVWMDGALFWFASSPLSPGEHPWPVIGGVLCHLQIAHLEAFSALPSNQLGYGHWCGMCVISGAPGTVLNKGNTWNQS